ncbi:hypothetical protein YZ50_05290 [Campylobacter upsaliensis]|uniref:hypothetical protein n=1 Tax=Campylobacter upsaliensis TaxID=28080 RepID=UPI001273D3D8|nr:hypothetical protein [Campylobacter upsaliensis]EAI5623434.1 hypothetical protein [Campylobacter upsaliensis]EAJ1956588.1 hypothetical protein [Campylobacter upsaliensis]EAK0458176.1 hypothetical protein [Campylobacter upsaliensis]EAK0839663.1 hypothetical protein [Campylobacter upsaliensis]EAK0962776.1 hypothetical protein [Campylobacter upsaliensis]
MTLSHRESSISPQKRGKTQKALTANTHNSIIASITKLDGFIVYHSFLELRLSRRAATLWQTPAKLYQNTFNYKFTLSFILLSLVFSFTQANPLEPKNFSAPTLQELQAQQGNTENLQDLKTNEFYLNLNPKEIDSIQKKDDAIREAFDRFSQKEINYKPVIRPIASMDSISLHPYFTFTLLLPKGSIINHIDSSSPMAVLKFENNALLIRPNADFKIANLTILYKLKDTNHILNILATLYERNNELDKLNLVYSYSNLEKLDDLEVIQAYIKENKAMPKQKYSYIQINDISYRIVEDEDYGKVFIAGKKYRVDNNTIYR